MISIIYYIVICLSIILAFILIITAIKTLYDTRKKNYNYFMINRIERQILRLEQQIEKLGSNNVNKQKLIDEIKKLKEEKKGYEKN